MSSRVEAGVSAMRVAIAGIRGNMGRLTASAVMSDPQLALVGGFARAPSTDEHVYNDIGQMLERTTPDVVVDFTTHPATLEVARTCVERGVPVVIGSSAWTAQEREDLARRCAAKGVGAMLVPNFAVGAILMMQFAKMAAKYFSDVEIVELHRAEKLDKPSGTAHATAEEIASETGRTPAIHSVRLRGLLAHQEVLFGNAGELLTIRHDSLSRESFAPGILMAIRRVCSLRTLAVGLEL